MLMKFFGPLLGAIGAICLAFGVPLCFTHAGKDDFFMYFVIALVGLLLLLGLAMLYVFRKKGRGPDTGDKP